MLGVERKERNKQMKATEILMSEHQVILRVIAALESAAHRLDEGQPVQPAFFLEAADFIKGFADGCHHRKEEGVLFVAMQESGVPVQGGPLGVMLYEHEQGRAFTAACVASRSSSRPGSRERRGEVVRNALQYAGFAAPTVARRMASSSRWLTRSSPPTG
jgi:hemerythrin-like domain-containing protein